MAQSFLEASKGLTPVLSSGVSKGLSYSVRSAAYLEQKQICGWSAGCGSE